MQKTWTKNPALVGQIDFANLQPLERYAGGHDSHMKGLFRGASVLVHWNENDYQGTVATAHLHPDGTVTAIVDTYGSCSGCDAWKGSSWDDARKMLIGLAESALVFPNAQAFEAFLRELAAAPLSWDEWKQLDLDFEWDDKVAKGLLEEINLSAHG